MTSPIELNAPTDFDFMIGSWKVKHRRLKERLKNCQEWLEFDGLSNTQKLLGGFGNVEDNQLLLPDDHYRAVALRSYNAQTKLWSIWWLDGRMPGTLDTPVVGGFENGIGLFYANDTLNGQAIRIRFTWIPHYSESDIQDTELTEATAKTHPRWEQAFSTDDGKTWETNWTMQFIRCE